MEYVKRLHLEELDLEEYDESANFMVITCLGARMHGGGQEGFKAAVLEIAEESENKVIAHADEFNANGSIFATHYILTNTNERTITDFRKLLYPFGSHYEPHEPKTLQQLREFKAQIIEGNEEYKNQLELDNKCTM